MITLNSLFTASIFLLSFFSFSLGIFSLIKNPQSKTVRLWFLKCMAVGLWSAAFLFLTISQTEQQAIFASKLLHVGASFIPIFFYHFIIAFLCKDSKNQQLLLVGYILAIIFMILSWTKFIVVGVAPIFGFKFWVIVGNLYPLLLVYFWIYVIMALYLLYQGYKSSDGVMKRKIGWIFVASLFGFLGGGMSFLPQTIGVYAFGDFVAWLYPILITYGIFVEEIKFKFNV